MGLPIPEIEPPIEGERLVEGGVTIAVVSAIVRAAAKRHDMEGLNAVGSIFEAAGAITALAGIYRNMVAHRAEASPVVEPIVDTAPTDSGNGLYLLR